MKAAADSAAARKAGRAETAAFGSVAAIRPPSAGPIVKPRPKAAPIMPHALGAALGRGDVADVSLRCRDVAGAGAGKRAAPRTASRARRQARARHKRRPEKARLTSSTGRRPTRSLKRPRSGDEMNCAREKHAIIQVTSPGLAPKCVP